MIMTSVPFPVIKQPDRQSVTTRQMIAEAQSSRLAEENRAVGCGDLTRCADTILYQELSAKKLTPVNTPRGRLTQSSNWLEVCVFVFVWAVFFISLFTLTLHEVSHVYLFYLWFKTNFMKMIFWEKELLSISRKVPGLITSLPPLAEVSLWQILSPQAALHMLLLRKASAKWKKYF